MLFIFYGAIVAAVTVFGKRGYHSCRRTAILGVGYCNIFTIKQLLPCFVLVEAL